MLRSVVRLAIVGALLTASLVRAQAAPPSVEEGIRELAVQLANAMSAEPGAQSAGNGAVRKLAVIEFSDLNGYRSALGSFIAEELTTQLFVAKPGVFDIVERQQLAKVLQEQKLGSTGLFDAETIANIGKILGIQAIITGSIADLGENVKINARLISVESARVFAAASVKCPKKGVVETLMRQDAAPDKGGAQPTERPEGRQMQASDVFFQNDFVRLTVDSLAVTKNGGSATLSLRLENLTTADLLLAVIHPFNPASHACRTIEEICSRQPAFIRGERSGSSVWTRTTSCLQRASRGPARRAAASSPSPFVWTRQATPSATSTHSVPSS